MPGKDTDVQFYQSSGPGCPAKTQMPSYIDLQDLSARQRQIASLIHLQDLGAQQRQMASLIHLQDLGAQQRLRCPVISIFRTWAPSKDSHAQFDQSSGPGHPVKTQMACTWVPRKDSDAKFYQLVPRKDLDAQFYQSSGPGCPAKTQMSSFINFQDLVPGKDSSHAQFYQSSTSTLSVAKDPNLFQADSED